MSAESYKPVPVAEARRIADEYAKAVVVIFAWDEAHDLVHTTTYGQTAEQKPWAARAGEVAAAALGCDLSQASINEDFRQQYKPALLSEAAHLLARIAQSNDPALQGLDNGRWIGGTLMADIERFLEKARQGEIDA